MPTGREIMERVSTLLNDVDHVRWPLSELAYWINDAVRAIVLVKPSAAPRTIVFALVEGTRQTVPTANGVQSLLKVIRNVKSVEQPEARRAIRPSSMAELDAQEPNWHDKRFVPYKSEARLFLFDEVVPTEFYVYPGNNGSGAVEASVAVVPPALVADGDDITSLDAWEGDIGLQELYLVPVVDYVMYRAQSRDDDNGNAGRAAAHYAAFAQAIGIKITAEGSNSPRRPS